MRSPRITFIGAGSTVFAKNLIGDLLGYPELAAARIMLFDIDEKRLAESEIVARRINEAVGARATIEATTDRSKALDGADYAINLQPPVPVHLVYFTAYAGDDRIQYRPDIYGRDAQIFKALTRAGVSLRAAGG